MPYGREGAHARNGSQAGYRSGGTRAFAVACRLGRALADTSGGVLVFFLALVNFLQQ
jgi:hypothetical protein